MINQIWKLLLVEFVGTFTLVFVGASAAALSVEQGGNILITALAFGLILAALIYNWGSISGMHANPAVSLGFACSGRLDWKLLIGFWIAQILGGILAAALILYFFGSVASADVSGSLTEGSSSDMWKAVLLEALLTFFLVVTILTTTKNPNLSLANGIAAGAVLSAAMMSGIPYTGGSLNPARSFGMEIFNSTLSKSWIYILGPLLGGLVAAVVFKAMDADWSCVTFTDSDGAKRKFCQTGYLDPEGRPLMDRETGLPIVQESIAEIDNGSFRSMVN